MEGIAELRLMPLNAARSNVHPFIRRGGGYIMM